MNSFYKLFFLLLMLMIICFLNAQDTIEEIVTWELDNEEQFRCFNSNVTGSDINNDGYDDFIHWNPGDPYRFQFFMGSENPNSSFDFEIEVPFGSAYISWGGDLNGDGFKDLVFSNQIMALDPGEIHICFGGEVINLEPEFIINGTSPSYETIQGSNGGYDFNDDNYSDILVYSPGPEMAYCGQIDIYFGGVEFDCVSDFHLEGSLFNELGKYRSVGDLNGDGFDDLIISRNIEQDVLSGLRFEIYFGGTDMDDELDLELDDTFFYESPISCKGDFNGDGLNDIVVSTAIIPNESHPYILLYFGNTTGDFVPTILIDSLYTNCLYYSNINNDIYDDLVIKTYENNSHNIDIYYGNNDEDFIRDIRIPFTFQNNYHISCNVGDFNGDDEDEILINTGESPNIATLYGLSEGNSVEEEINSRVASITNYPNPFNPITIIEYSISQKSKVELKIYNIKGQKVKQLISDQLSAGQHLVVWNGDDESGKSVSSGIYFYKLNVNGKTEVVRKCLLLK